jgi:uncharacterized membrane protein
VLPVTLCWNFPYYFLITETQRVQRLHRETEIRALLVVPFSRSFIL